MSANCNVSLPCAVAAPHAVSSSELGEPCPVSCHDANAILTTEPSALSETAGSKSSSGLI
jgi:hypothetical protein